MTPEEPPADAFARLVRGDEEGAPDPRLIVRALLELKARRDGEKEKQEKKQPAA